MNFHLFKNLICVSQTGSSSGAVRYAIQKIKKYNIKVELFSVVSRENIFRMFLEGSKDREDLTEFNDAKKYLKNLSNQIFLETGFRPEFNVFKGDLSENLKKKILEDSSICCVILGAKNDSWDKKKLPNLMKKFFNFSTIPLVIVPQNITDIQINNLIYND
jgi:hypothetical protein